ncbi:recombinase family protein [Micromonospora sp. B11E3]|uniref:recombinase family protein n=1 Tax=Micromonospora sp. B11E3 TaxID=3153562 RepID=UPI00325EA9DB
MPCQGRSTRYSPTSDPPGSPWTASKHLVRLAPSIAVGRHFRTLDGIVLDTSDDMCGELIFTVFAAIAEFQRQQIVKGTREGLDAARARGRPRALTLEQVADARMLLGVGQTQAAVAGKLGVSRWTLRRALDTTSD